MTSVTHAFVSTLSDDAVAAGAGEVLPSEWNAQHVLTGIRTALSANQNYYVAVGGSDSANGLSPATAWATIQRAVNFIAENVDIAGFDININIGAGSFVGADVPAFSGGGGCQFTGAGTASTTVTGLAGIGCLRFLAATLTFFAMTDITFDATLGGSGSAAVNVLSVVNVSTGDVLGVGTNTVAFRSSASPSNTPNVLSAANLAQMFPFATATITGSWNAALNVNTFSFIQDFSPWTMVGTPSFSSFCFVTGQALYEAFGASFTGAATGTRFFSLGGSVIESSGVPGTLGPNFFPGSSAGFVDFSSSYDGFLGTNLTYPKSTTTARTVLTANISFFVATTGSDSNPGSSTSPWATLQHAIFFIAGNIDISGFTITVNVGAGSFAGFGYASCVGGGQISILGAGSGSTSITAGPNDGVFNFGDVVDIEFSSLTFLNIDGAALKPSASTIVISLDQFVPSVTIGLNAATKVVWPAGGGVLTFLCDSYGSVLTLGPSLTFAATAGGTQSTMAVVSQGGQLVNQSSGTFSGTLTVSNPFVIVASYGFWTQSSGGGWGSSTVVGQRFSVGNNGAIFSSSGIGVLGPTFFPGNSAGTVDASSTYDGFVGPLPGIDTQTGASYTLALTDVDAIVEMNNAGANTVTVPTNATTAFSIGTRIYVTQTGAGATTIAGAGGVTVDNAGVVGGQWKSVKLYKRGTNEWVQTNA